MVVVGALAVVEAKEERILFFLGPTIVCFVLACVLNQEKGKYIAGIICKKVTIK